MEWKWMDIDEVRGGVLAAEQKIDIMDLLKLRKIGHFTAQRAAPCCVGGETFIRNCAKDFPTTGLHAGPKDVLSESAPCDVTNVITKG